MIDKIKAKFKTNSKAKKKDANKSLWILLLSILVFLLLLFLTMNLPLALISALCVYFLIYYVLDGLKLNKKEKKKESIEKEKLTFYKNLLLYASLENDYKEGIKLASSLLPICELKDRLITYQENEFKGSLPVSETNSAIDNQIVELINNNLFADETSKDVLERLEKLIDDREKELSFSRMNSFPLINLPLALYLLAFTLAFSLT